MPPSTSKSLKFCHTCHRATPDDYWLLTLDGKVAIFCTDGCAMRRKEKKRCQKK